jgi:23S rRNA A2030 N6-methylase RlmJ
MEKDLRTASVKISSGRSASTRNSSEKSYSSGKVSKPMPKIDREMIEKFNKSHNAQVIRDILNAEAAVKATKIRKNHTPLTLPM